MSVPVVDQAEQRGRQIPDYHARAAPGADWAVELGGPTPVIRDGLPPAMEMSVLWKSQTDFHRTLEISHRPRDSHISTADPRFDIFRRKTKERTRRVRPQNR
jgi:hypothetical protein